jgi:chromosome segregation protein
VSRIKAAIRKLDATQNDLLRINDIIQEVERSVRSLKRQVGRAKRYQVLQEKIKDIELKRSSQLFHQLKEKIKPIKIQLHALRSQKDGRTTEIVKEEADLESLRLKLVEQEKILTKSQEQLNETLDQIRRTEGDIRVNKERITSLEEQITRNIKEIEGLKKRLDDQKNHLEVSIQGREALQVKITSTSRIFNNKKKELKVFQQGLNLKRLELNNKKREFIECLEKINHLNNEETKIRTKIDNNQGRLERLDEEDLLLRGVQKSAQTNLNKSSLTALNLEKEKNKRTQARQNILKEETKTRETLDQSQESLLLQQGTKTLIQGKINLLRNVIESKEGISDGTKKLLTEKIKGLIGILAEAIDVTSEHRLAIETGLGEAANYLIFEKDTSVHQAIEVLKKKGGGKATLVCLDRLKPAPKKINRPTLPKNRNTIGWADEMIQYNPKLQSLIRYVLGDLLIVKDLEQAQKTLSNLGDESIRIVTLNGELVTGWGLIQTKDSLKEEIGILGRQKRLKELEIQLKKVEEAIHKEQIHRTEIASKIQLIQKEKEIAEKSQSDIDGQISELEKERIKYQFEKEKADETLQKHALERQRLLEEIENSNTQIEDIRSQSSQLVEKRENIEQITNKIQIEVDRLEDEDREKEEEVHQKNLTLVRLNGEAKNLDYDIERSQHLIKDIETTIRERTDQTEQAKEEIQVLKGKNQENEKSLTTGFSKKDQLEAKHHTQEEQYKLLRGKLDEQEKEIRQVRRNRDEVSEKIHDLDINLSDYQHQAQSLKDRIQEAYDINLEKLKPQETVDMDESEVEIDNLKQKLKALGLVNLAALEEYGQNKERLDFLTQQREDLISAEETLNGTIQKINETARQRFIEVFGKVRSNFQETFQRFFQGGEADLRLSDGEDPLEAPIEIFARPAGKQLRDLSLLSGGERALTAISLLFALYMVKPSPFCILDEIDAPLDDANIGRFTRVLNEYAEKTQFIIVTHNKMTMRVAQTLYGVTMEEEGVSKIVSVKFEND